MLEEIYFEGSKPVTSIVNWISNSITGYDMGFYSFVDSNSKIYSTIRIERNPLRGKVLKVQKVC